MISFNTDEADKAFVDGFVSSTKRTEEIIKLCNALEIVSNFYSIRLRTLTHEESILQTKISGMQLELKERQEEIDMCSREISYMRAAREKLL